MVDCLNYERELKRYKKRKFKNGCVLGSLVLFYVRKYSVFAQNPQTSNLMARKSK